MRAVVHDRYGPPEVLRLDEVERPVPKDDEILVAVRATSVTRADAYLRAGTPFVQRFQSGLRRPKRRVLGQSSPERSWRPEPQSRCSRSATASSVLCAYLALRTGAYADFMAIPEGWPLARIPEGMDFEQVAGVAGGAPKETRIGVDCAGVVEAVG